MLHESRQTSLAELLHAVRASHARRAGQLHGACLLRPTSTVVTIAHYKAVTQHIVAESLSTRYCPYTHSRTNTPHAHSHTHGEMGFLPRIGSNDPCGQYTEADPHLNCFAVVAPRCTRSPPRTDQNMPSSFEPSYCPSSQLDTKNILFSLREVDRILHSMGTHARTRHAS
jgi:hypothetical protein